MSKIHEREEYGRAKAYFDNLLADTEPDMLPVGDVNNEPASAGSFLIPSDSIAPESVAPEIGGFCEKNSLTKLPAQGICGHYSLASCTYQPLPEPEVRRVPLCGKEENQ